jgi:alpha-L-arabinofuranosidase
VQQLFSRNRGDAVLPVKFSTPSNAHVSPKLYASASYDRANREVILKLVNAAPEPCDLVVRLEGARPVKPEAAAILLTGEKPTDENSLDAPSKVSRRSLPIRIESPAFNQTVAARSLMVLLMGFQ